MADKTVIITGGNAGLGYQCARNIALSDTGYHPVLACRSLPRGESITAVIRANTPLVPKLRSVAAMMNPDNMADNLDSE